MPARPHSIPPAIPDLHVGFFIAGMGTTLLGPVLPALAARWQVSDALMGLAFTIQFLGSVSMSVASSSLVLRFGGFRVMTAGFVLLALGIGGLSVAPWAAGLACVLCYGCGLGLVLPTTNVLVAAARPGREASAVSLVNVSWSGGAVTWPLLVAWAGPREHDALPLMVLAALAVGMAVRLRVTDAGHLAVRRPPDVSEARDASPQTSRATHASSHAAETGASDATATIALFGALLFFYAGAESSIGGWVAEHVRRMESPASNRHWAMAPMVFWAALALGRLVTPLLLRVVPESRVLFVAFGVVLVATGVLATAGAVSIAFASAAAAGLGLAPVFPITFVDLSRTLARVRPRAIGPAYAMSSFGSAALPWLVGFCSTRFGSLRAGLVVPMVSMIVMIALTAVRLARRRRTNPA